MDIAVPKKVSRFQVKRCPVQEMSKHYRGFQHHVPETPARQIVGFHLPQDFQQNDPTRAPTLSDAADR
jgi:hypothetical protein